MSRSTKPAKPYIVVFCEGESEQAYTDFLRKEFKDVPVLNLTVSLLDLLSTFICIPPFYFAVNHLIFCILFDCGWFYRYGFRKCME